MPNESDVECTVNVEVGDKVYPIKYKDSYKGIGEGEELCGICTQVAICPIEYDGLVLFCEPDDGYRDEEGNFVLGEEKEGYEEYTLDQILSKECDTIFFGF